MLLTILASIAVRNGQLSTKPILVLGRNLGIFGPLSSDGFAVLRRHEPGAASVTFYSSKGIAKRKYILSVPEAAVVGITTQRRLAFTDLRPDYYVGDRDAEYGWLYKTETLAVAGKYALLNLERGAGLRLLDTGSQHYLSCPLAPPGRFDAISLSSNPLVVAIYRERTSELQLYRSASGRVQTLRLIVKPSKYQKAEIHLDGQGHLYYMSDDEHLGLPEFVERTLKKGESYYTRSLVRLDLANRAIHFLARVRTAGDDPRSKVAYDMEAKFPGNDIVIFNDHVLVRADSMVYALPIIPTQ